MFSNVSNFVPNVGFFDGYFSFPFFLEIPWLWFLMRSCGLAFPEKV
jgi:hypothetical protein